MATIFLPPQAYSQHESLTNISRQIVVEIADDIMALQPHNQLLSGFTTNCISLNGLSLHYSNNVVKGVKGMVLGNGPACEIVITFSPLINHGMSPIPWGNFTKHFPSLSWQVCSYPACYWIPGKPGEPFLEKFGGRFIRSTDLDLCITVDALVCKRLAPLEEMERKAKESSKRVGGVISSPLPHHEPSPAATASQAGHAGPHPAVRTVYSAAAAKKETDFSCTVMRIAI